MPTAIKPSQSPIKPTFTGSGSRVFAAAVSVFVASTSFAYLLVDATGLNVPSYYPQLHSFSTVPIAGEISLSLYGDVAAAFATGVLITAVFLLLSPLLHALHVLRTSHLTVLVSSTVWAVVALLVVRTWQHWGIAARGLDTTDINNAELALYVVGLVIFLGGGLITAAAVRRVAALNPPTARQLVQPAQRLEP